MTDYRTILLAEDSQADAEMAIDALREANLINPIVHVEDGVEALDYLLRRGKFANRGEGMPAVLLLDIKMPRMDGLEVLQAIREHARQPRAPGTSRTVTAIQAMDVVVPASVHADDPHAIGTIDDMRKRNLAPTGGSTRRSRDATHRRRRTPQPDPAAG